MYAMQKRMGLRSELACSNLGPSTFTDAVYLNVATQNQRREQEKLLGKVGS